MIGWLLEFLSDVRHNAAIDKRWRDNGRPIVQVAIGWRPDPWNKEDGFRDVGDGHTYSRLLRGGRKG